ncbi:MAG: ABC transporter permease [Oscillospiraceae bacterium]|nr:ABC transporter permease [Oscillospiraceae bacterium]
MMNRVSTIFAHYFKRSVRHPINLLVYIGLPLALVVLNMLGNIGMFELQGGDLAAAEAGITATATFIAAMFMVSFQFFSGELLIYNLYDDLKEGSVRWRLAATPIPRRAFISGAVMASWIFNLAQAFVLFGVSALVFNVHFGNPLMFVSIILLVSIISQLFAAFISQIAPKRKAATVAFNILCFGMMFLSGMLFIPLGNSPIATFIQQQGTPLALGFRAILYAGPVFDDMSRALLNLGILGIIALVLATLVFVLGRRHKS